MTTKCLIYEETIYLYKFGVEKNLVIIELSPTNESLNTQLIELLQ